MGKVMSCKNETKNVAGSIMPVELFVDQEVKVATLRKGWTSTWGTSKGRSET
jgi:hypothetical protein